MKTIKILALIIVSIIFSTHTIHPNPFTYYIYKYKTYGFFATSIGTMLLSEKIASSSGTQWITKKTNTDAHDLTSVLIFSPLCIGLSYYMPTRTIANTLYYGALILPIFRIIATSTLYNKAWGIIPFIGKRLTCTNKECEGICDHCKYRLLIKELPFGGLLEWYSIQQLLWENQQRPLWRKLWHEKRQENAQELYNKMAQELENSEKPIDINTLPPFPHSTTKLQSLSDDQIAKIQKWYVDNLDEGCPICAATFQAPQNIVLTCNAHHSSEAVHAICRSCAHKNQWELNICPTCRNPRIFYALPDDFVLDSP